ncbi:heme-binding protein [Amaricoccus solimangrovi]|uniref:heme-binding protein n=1 Tax=Amaricoccus solimangrovi TaxID=2589815 RepID=UPI0015E3CA9C|nr:heme-binding protein [Amaricoccus solimangrovi]
MNTPIDAPGRPAQRYVGIAAPDDPRLGPLKDLPGTWKNQPNLPGRGWNMIALPFAKEGDRRNFRLLLNQFDEVLKFNLIDDDIPNRGIVRTAGGAENADQFVVALDYEQMIAQVVAEDFPPTDLAGPPELPIHHEPGLWMHMPKEVGDGHDLARLATIPHGDSVLALGDSETIAGPPVIPKVNGLPVGVPHDLTLGYLEAYRHFHENLFRGLFDPTDPSALLAAANEGVDIEETVVLTVDTTIDTGGIHNIPFIVKQANASDMKATFWIQRLREKNADGTPKLRLQYLQIVNLDFFDRFDGAPGRIKWPHVSINTLEKVVEQPDGEAPRMPYADPEVRVREIKG